VGLSGILRLIWRVSSVNLSCATVFRTILPASMTSGSIVKLVPTVVHSLLLRALDLQELVHEVNTFLNAANMIDRIGKT
jgi:hypothetical protein